MLADWPGLPAAGCVWCVVDVKKLAAVVQSRKEGGVVSHKKIRFFLNFYSYINHTRPDPITKRVSAVPPSKWRDASHICLPIDLLTFLLTAEEGHGLVERS